MSTGPHSPIMDTLKAIFLLTALCTGTGFALQCYTCEDQASNTNCMNATNCPAASTYCQTSVVTGGIGSLPAPTIYKSCESECKAGGFDILIVSGTMSCCSTDLCNKSGATSVKSSYAILALCLGLFLTLIRNPSL
ncbi:lymphocyte antigen 6E-like [Pelobates fuscus]|uniref:lymphocyte antigen 6E-like n=1 Tax=Pelobates fuscus TaxID=191477 RepID=UPI002FE4A177